MGNEHSCVVVWTLFAITFLWDQNEDWSFPVLWPLLSFLNFLAYWGQPFSGSSFRIWYSSTGIPPPTLVLFAVMQGAHIREIPFNPTTHIITFFGWRLAFDVLSGGSFYWLHDLFNSTLLYCIYVIEWIIANTITSYGDYFSFLFLETLISGTIWQKTWWVEW